MRNCLLFTFVFFISCQESNPNQASIDAFTELTKKIYDSGFPYSNRDNARRELQLLRSFPEDVVLERRYNYFVELLNAGLSQDCIRQLESHLRVTYGLKDIQAGPADMIKRANQKYFRLLALAYLRQAEQDNCISNHVAESCILPLEGDAIHRQKEFALKAFHLYEKLIRFDENDYEAKWLIHIASMASDMYEPSSPLYISPEIFKSHGDFPRFVNRARELGVDVLSGAGGTSMEDFNNDGYLDLFTTGYAFDEGCKIFIGNGKSGFEDRSRKMKVDKINKALNFIHADFDNDGWIDILLLRGGWLKQYGQLPLAFLKNMEGKYFLDITSESGLVFREATQTASVADIDLDGDLDLFIGYESPPGRRIPCRMLENDGKGKFRDITQETGLELYGFVKGAVFSDFNNDGYPDLYISVIGDSNHLFMNGGHESGGRYFADKAAEYGVREPVWSFPVMSFDIDNNGWQDLIVCSYDNRRVEEMMRSSYAEISGGQPLTEPMKIYMNYGEGKFVERSADMNLNRSILTMGCNYGDLNNDGYEDFYLGTGEFNLAVSIPNRMFLNQGGTAFRDVTFLGGFGQIQKGHGVSFGDFDRDGDQDIYHNVGGAVEGDRYRNMFFENPGNDFNSVCLLLRSQHCNRFAVGARICCSISEDGISRRIYKSIGTGGSFGNNSLQCEIGIGKARRIDSLWIDWPDKLNSRDSFFNIIPGDGPILVDQMNGISGITSGKLQ